MSGLKARPTRLKTPAGCRRYQVELGPSEGGGVDCGYAAFDGDAFDFYGFGEDGALEAVGKDFEYIAYFGATCLCAQNVHGLRFDLIDAHANGHALGLIFGHGRFFDGFLHR
jgi:hypothetical protein